MEDEAGDVAVDGAGVVEGGGAEGEEVCGCLGDGLAEDFELEGAEGCVECDGHCAIILEKATIPSFSKVLDRYDT